MCERTLPSLDTPATTTARARGGSVRRDNVQTTPFGSVGDRMIALIFDRLLVVSIMVVIAAWAVSAKYQIPNTPLGIAQVAGAFVLVAFLYHFISESIFLTTVGKAAMGLHLAVEEGHNRFGSVAIRNVLRIIDSIGGYLVGFLFATFGRKRQRVGDLVGHTVVVEWPIARGGRAAVMFLLIAITIAAMWMAAQVCPTCGTTVQQQLSALR